MASTSTGCTFATLFIKSCRHNTVLHIPAVSQVPTPALNPMESLTLPLDHLQSGVALADRCVPINMLTFRNPTLKMPSRGHVRWLVQISALDLLHLIGVSQIKSSARFQTSQHRGNTSTPGPCQIAVIV